MYIMRTSSSAGSPPRQCCCVTPAGPGEDGGTQAAPPRSGPPRSCPRHAAQSHPPQALRGSGRSPPERGCRPSSWGLLLLRHYCCPAHKHVCYDGVFADQNGCRLPLQNFDMINLCVETHNPAARPLETSQACSSLGDADSYETVGVLKSQASFLIEACYYAVRIGRGCASVQSRPSQHAHKLTPTAPQVLALTYSYCLATDNRSVHARTEPAPPGLAYPVQGVQAPDSTSVISR